MALATWWQRAGGLVAVLCAGVALAGVPPASADESPGGVYTVDLGEGRTATWTVSPCDDAPTVGWIRVSEIGDPVQLPWQGTATQSVGSWMMFVDQPGAISCADGKKFPGRTSYSWNATALIGWVSVYDNGVCGGDPRRWPRR